MSAAPRTRCPWAIRYGVLATRCVDGAGHLGSSGEAGPHIGRGLEAYPYQRIQWFPGDRHEFTTDRNDRFSWEVTP